MDGKIKKTAIAFSLPVQHWVKKRWGYQGLLRIHNGKCRNVSNVCRDARRAGIARPKELTRAQVEDGIRYCNNRLWELKVHDKALRKVHLRDRVIEATQLGDDTRRRGVLVGGTKIGVAYH